MSGAPEQVKLRRSTRSRASPLGLRRLPESDEPFPKLTDHCWGRCTCAGVLLNAQRGGQGAGIAVFDVGAETFLSHKAD